MKIINITFRFVLQTNMKCMWCESHKNPHESVSVARTPLKERHYITLHCCLANVISFSTTIICARCIRVWLGYLSTLFSSVALMYLIVNWELFIHQKQLYKTFVSRNWNGWGVNIKISLNMECSWNGRNYVSSSVYNCIT